MNSPKIFNISWVIIRLGVIFEVKPLLTDVAKNKLALDAASLFQWRTHRFVEKNSIYEY